MIHRSVEITIAGRRFRLYFGYGAQRKAGYKSSLELIRRTAALFLFNAEKKPVDVNTDVLIDLLWCGLHQPESPDNKRLVPEALSKQEVSDLLERHIEEGLDAGEAQINIVGALANAVDYAVDIANVVPKAPAKQAGDKPDTEAGEATEDPTPTSGSPSGENSAPLPSAESDPGTSGTSAPETSPTS